MLDVLVDDALQRGQAVVIGGGRDDIAAGDLSQRAPCSSSPACAINVPGSPPNEPLISSIGASAPSEVRDPSVIHQTTNSAVSNVTGPTITS